MTRRLLFLCFLALLGLTLVACGPSRGGGGDDDDSAGDDDDSAGDDDDSTGDDDDDSGTDNDSDGVTAEDGDCDDNDPNNFPGNQEDCADEADNDCDELADCDDSDCEEFAGCVPAAVEHEGWLQFTSTSPVIGEDCETLFTTVLTIDPTQEPCEGCDAIYRGELKYLKDTCSQVLPTPLPAGTQYGLTFVGEGQLEVFAFNEETSVWDLLGTATPEDGWLLLHRTDPVDAPVFGKVGQLDTYLRFRLL